MSYGGIRRWLDRVKVQIVSETLLPGASVNEVALRDDLRLNYRSAWRRMAKDGEFVLPAPEAEADFAPLVAFDVDAPPLEEVAEPVSSTVEIAAETVVVRMDGASPAARIADIFRWSASELDIIS